MGNISDIVPNLRGGASIGHRYRTGLHVLICVYKRRYAHQRSQKEPWTVGKGWMDAISQLPRVMVRDSGSGLQAEPPVGEQRVVPCGRLRQCEHSSMFPLINA